MAARILIFLTVFSVFLASSIALDEEDYFYTYNGFSLPAEVTMPVAETHPSLWFSESQIEALLAKREVDAVARGYWDSVVGSEFVLADLPDLPGLDSGTKVIHKYYGSLTQIAAYNAFLYQVSSSNREAYLAKAVEALARGYAGPMYELDPIVKGSAVDEIYQGVWAQNFAAAYDWVQPALSKEDDSIIRDHLVKHARYLHENLWSWASSPHNHLSKPAWGLGSLALCLSGHPEAKAWLERAVEASNGNTRYFFSGDGIYREGTHYYTFSLINFLPFLYHYRNTSGYDAFGPFQPAFEWPVFVRNGKGWLPTFEDSFLRPYPSNIVAGAYRDTPTRLHSTAPLAEVLQWNFQATDYAVFDKAERESGYNYSGATWDYTKALVEFLCYEPGIVATAPDVSPVQFLESGQTVFRSDWKFEDPASRTLIFQGVAEADNHGHFDHLSFVLHAENQMMSSDSGYTRSSYGEPIRKEWYLTADAHNVVLANGKALGDTLPNVGPLSRARLASPFFSCEIKEAPYAEGGVHQRLVAMVDGRNFAILDKVVLPEAGEVGIVMHGGRASLESTDALNAWSYGDDDYGPASGLRQWFWGKGFSTERLEGELTYIKGDYAPFPYLKFKKVGAEALGLSVLEPVAAGVVGTDYVYERKSETTIIVRSSDGMEWFAANSTGAALGESAWKTDALFSYFKAEADGEVRSGLVDASFVRLGKKLEIQLNGKAAMALKRGALSNELELHYAASERVEGVARFEGKVYRLELKGSGMLVLR